MTRECKLLQAVADPMRLRILVLLREMELSVGELALVLAQRQPLISKHLKILVDADLVTKRKEGNWAFLRLGQPALVDPIFALLDRWAEVEDKNPWFAADRARLTAIKAERAEEAARYFRMHAADWDKLTGLHVPVEEVNAAIMAALGDHKLGRLVDLGTGVGNMLLLLSEKAEHMIGIDRSPDMLRFAREKLTDAGIANAELAQGDIYGLDLPSGSAETVILHQVLHYAQHPAAVISEAARLLAPSGRLLIVDVAPHEREELRHDHAHARLGFSDEEVLGYLTSAGLEGAVRDHLAGGELTITIWTGRPAAARLKAVK